LAKFSQLAKKMLYTILTLPEGFLASTTAWIGDTFADLAPIIGLVIGLPLAFWLIRKVISLFKGG